MYTHKLIILTRILEERIGSLIEEVEIATNVKLNPLYINDRKDEVESLQWAMRIIRWILDQTNDDKQLQLGVTNLHLELDGSQKFENILHEKIQELEIEFEDSVTAREKEVLTNRIDTLKCVLGHLFNLKSRDNMQVMEIADTNNSFQITNREREQLITFQQEATTLTSVCQCVKAGNQFHNVITSRAFNLVI